jgi:hypothetical protein
MDLCDPAWGQGEGSAGRDFAVCAAGIEPACQHPAGAVLGSAALSCRHPISNLLKSNCPICVIDSAQHENILATFSGGSEI